MCAPLPFALHREIRQALVSPGRGVTLVLLDVVSMASINARDGWLAGSQVLAETAARLSDFTHSLHGDAAAGRTGGDAFALVLRFEASAGTRAAVEAFAARPVPSRDDLSLCGGAATRGAAQDHHCEDVVGRGLVDLLSTALEMIAAAKVSGPGCVRWTECPRAGRSRTAPTWPP